MSELPERVLSMEEKIKETVARYIKKPVAELTAQTVIDRSAVAGSVIIHRMYAQLAAEGIVVADYTSIKTLGQLLTAAGGSVTDKAVQVVLPSADDHTASVMEQPVGIDIEKIDAMPMVTDYRSDEFYTMNFAPAEIAYCILQTNPRASFAGLFAAKEAIVKANNKLKTIPFHSIIIDHLPGGQPVFPGFQLSISHTNETAVAVAVKNAASPAVAASPSPNHTAIYFSAFTALAFSVLALLLIIFKSC